MMTPPGDVPVHEVQLGDIVVLPDGRALTVRCRVSLGAPVGNMAGFLVAGELDVLLATPAHEGLEFGVYVPIAYMPEDPKRLRLAYDGVSRYWAPHLPAAGQAMAEVLYQVYEVRGSIDPIVVIHRGPEQVVFIKASYARPEHVRFTAMPRVTDNEHDVERVSSVVVPAGLPIPQPSRETETTRRRRRFTRAGR